MGKSCMISNIHSEKEIYDKKVYRGFGKPQPERELVYGPNIRPWPRVYVLWQKI